MFGEVAELYDASRPTYPEQLIDDVLALAGMPHTAIEVGAGTGKATALVAARGVGVLAIEPSSEMATVARRNLARYPQVEIVESDFERWDPAGRRFPLLYSAQAWHWVDPTVNFTRARSVLELGGLLAAFWNREAWGESPLREALRQAYRTVVPGLSPDGPLHPDNHVPDGEEGWNAEIMAADGFGQPEVRYYEWGIDYSTADYVRRLATSSEIRLLTETEREALLVAVAAAIDAHGGTLAMPLRTRLCLARAV